MAQYNFILVVGQQEVEARSVNVRTRENEVKGALPLDELVALFSSMTSEFQ